jgi:hypothetical protein
MANTATLRDTVLNGTGHSPNGPVHVYHVEIDTTGDDLTIRTPAAGNRVFVVGAFMSETNSGNLLLKSGSTYTHTLELSANQGMLVPAENHWIFVTKPGEALIAQASMIILSLMLYVVEGVEIKR